MSRPNESVRVTIETTEFRFEGDLHLPKMGKPQRCFTDLLNGDKRFIALTNAMITTRNTGKTENIVHPFIQVNLSKVEYIQIQDDELNQAEAQETII